LKNLFVRLLVLSGALALSLAAMAPTRTADAASASTSANKVVLAQIDDLRRTTWRLQQLMDRPKTPTRYDERRTADHRYRVWLRDLWKRRASRAQRQVKNPPRKAAWLCIHRYERHPAQGWGTRTGNGYYGGLQMDIAFQRAYGPELLRRRGTADNWRWFEQMWVAERAYRSGRGFYPWPNTARFCGLI
jgi:hypothetical protein